MESCSQTGASFRWMKAFCLNLITRGDYYKYSLQIKAFVDAKHRVISARGQGKVNMQINREIEHQVNTLS